ncbi:MAG: hypothetical protein IPO35_17850 [Uliginosibacterium sp.]|nr:hypothetical protein [Uliginosibacterium sp.]
MAFVKGKSGNPSGPPKIPVEVKRLAKAYTEDAIKTLADVMNNVEAPPGARVTAAEKLLDRAWGKSEATVNVNDNRAPRDLSTAEILAALAAAGVAGQEEGAETVKRFIDYIDLGFHPAKHHTLLIDALERVERGEIERLMVCMPPGSAKSTYTSVIFPAWFLGRNPAKSVIAASHTQELAERFGRRVRNIVAAREYGNVFGVCVAEDSAAAGRWDTDKGEASITRLALVALSLAVEPI